MSDTTESTVTEPARETRAFQAAATLIQRIESATEAA